jgi:hypothetical protein
MDGNVSNLEKEGRPGEKTIEGFISTFAHLTKGRARGSALTPY